MLIFKGILVPGIRKTQSGDLQVYREMSVTNGSKMECAIRMLEYVEGDICQKLPLCDAFFYEIGKIREISGNISLLEPTMVFKGSTVVECMH